MRFNPQKLAVGAMLFAVLAVGTASPAMATSESSNGFTFRWPWEQQTVAVESIDLGDYKDTMTVGTTQQLQPSVVPSNATDASMTMASEDSNIIQVGSNGLIQAVAKGTTRIIVSAGSVTNYYTITVVTDPSTYVSEMDITLSANRIAVGDNATASVQILPSNASNTDELTLSSSNPSVATVNNFGKVTGVAPGTANIIVSCGDVSASAKVTVVAASSSTVTTEHISLSTSYVVLKPGDSQQVTATVSPSSASNSFTFKSSDTNVATVSGKGVITAHKTGATSILVSNGTASASVTVIVNRTASSQGSGTDGENTDTETVVDTDPVVQAINSTEGDTVAVTQSDVPVLTSDILNALRLTGKTLTVAGDGYNMTVAGDNVKNTANSLDTAITFTEVENGVEFILNDGVNLPGDIEIELTGDTASYKRLYLYNTNNEEWQYLNSYSDGLVKADTNGKYLLTNEKLSNINVNPVFFIAAAVTVAVIGVAYILVKKRYWFW